MNIQEALNILKPGGNTEDSLKHAYRQACKKYHPDINPNGAELMKCINAAYEFLKRNINKWSFNNINDDPAIDEVLQSHFNKIKHFVNVNAEVCGTWLWLTGETWRYKKELKEYGFKWAFKKRAWYWHPGGYKRRHKKSFTLDEIRSKYGSYDLEQEPLTAVS